MLTGYYSGDKSYGGYYLRSIVNMRRQSRQNARPSYGSHGSLNEQTFDALVTVITSPRLYTHHVMSGVQLQSVLQIIIGPYVGITSVLERQGLDSETTIKSKIEEAAQHQLSRVTL